MQYIVEVCVSDRGLVDLMADMRTWLDHERIEPNGFRHRGDSDRMTFQVDFNSEPDATGFARAFGGRVVGGPATPVGAVLKEAVEQLPLMAPALLASRRWSPRRRTGIRRGHGRDCPGSRAGALARRRGPLFRGFHGRRHLRAPPGPHDRRGRQHLVHAADDEPAPAAFRREPMRPGPNSAVPWSTAA